MRHAMRLAMRHAMRLAKRAFLYSITLFLSGKKKRRKKNIYILIG